MRKTIKRFYNWMRETLENTVQPRPYLPYPILVRHTPTVDGYAQRNRDLADENDRLRRELIRLRTEWAPFPNPRNRIENSMMGVQRLPDNEDTGSAMFQLQVKLVLGHHVARQQMRDNPGRCRDDAYRLLRARAYSGIYGHLVLDVNELSRIAATECQTQIGQEKIIQRLSVLRNKLLGTEAGV